MCNVKTGRRKKTILNRAFTVHALKEKNRYIAICILATMICRKVKKKVEVMHHVCLCYICQPLSMHLILRYPWPPSPTSQPLLLFCSPTYTWVKTLTLPSENGRYHSHLFVLVMHITLSDGSHLANHLHPITNPNFLHNRSPSLPPSFFFLCCEDYNNFSSLSKFQITY